MSKKTFAQRFMDLKQKVGGNREKAAFEYTFGTPPEELMHVARPNKHTVRVLSELNFALQLNEHDGGAYDAPIDSALTILEQAMEADGVLVHAALDQAEAALMPLQAAAKEYELIYAGHAHIDMNWMWGLQETVASTLATFRTMLNLMKEYPEFTFMQSQGSVYKIVEKYDPAMMDEIKQRIAEGRWEITASAWVETDKNMPDTESLLHHISVTREYLHDVWGVEPDSVKVDFSPDTFGHSNFVPEINTFSGVKYYYHCRGLQEDKILYRYRAPSGAEVLMYKEPYWYNSGVNPDNGTGVIALSELCAGLKTGLIVYGVGDHGGGPTRRDVERVIEMQKWPVFPTLRFGRLQDFFAKAESVYDQLPVVEHEINPFAAGCYTTQSRIKLGNRRSEVSLNDSAKMSALGHLVAGAEYPAGRFREAWQDVLFTHFHDILTGSCVQESREHAMGNFANALSYTQTAQSNALRVISEAVDTSLFRSEEDISESQGEGAGAGYGIEAYAGVPNPERGVGRTRVYTVFNTASSDRDELVELTMWDYTGDIRRLEVVDADGSSLPFQLAGKPQKYWDHWYVTLFARVSVPALGYAVIAVREKEMQTYPTFRLSDERTEPERGPVVLENKFIRAQFDGENGALVSLIDKETGRECLAAPAGLACVATEQSTSSAWNIGRYLGVEPVSGTTKFRPLKGSLRNGIEIEQDVLHSTVKTIVTLDDNARELKYAFEVDWNETAKHSRTVPVLTFRLPAAGGAAEALCDVPAGLMNRSARDIDIPCSTFAGVVQDGRMVALAADCKYGYRAANGVLTCTLINSAGSPDPYPERGIHKITLWLAVGSACGLEMKRRTEALNRPMIAMPTAAKEGKLPAKMRLMDFASENCALTSVELTDEGALQVRCCELLGKEGEVSIRAPFAVASANMIDRSGRAADVTAQISGDAVSFPVKPHHISEVVIVPEKA